MKQILPLFLSWERKNSLRKNIRSRHNSKVIIINLKKNTIRGKMVLDCQGTSFTFILCWCHTWNSRASHQCQDWRLYLMKWIQQRILSLAFLCQKKEKMHNQKEKNNYYYFQNLLEYQYCLIALKWKIYYFLLWYIRPLLCIVSCVLYQYWSDV